MNDRTDIDRIWHEKEPTMETILHDLEELRHALSSLTDRIGDIEVRLARQESAIATVAATLEALRALLLEVTK